jgi:YVTN family beta-propeller protein
MRKILRSFLVILPLFLTLAAAIAYAASGTLPNLSYTSAQLYKQIGPYLTFNKHANFAYGIDGYLFRGGNAQHEIWNIANPTSPVKLSNLNSAHSAGEAESHQSSFAKYPDGKLYAATISGKGIDIWDITNAASPIYVKAVLINGINYGDFTSAVWGVFWQGNYIYVGGTNTGLHIVDATTPSAAAVISSVPTSSFCNVSAGFIYAMGNILTLGTPKQSAGIVTMNISNPANPTLLDCVTSTTSSYSSGFFGKNMHLINPYRTYDVLTDPANITLLGSSATPPSEYVHFDEGKLFLGLLRGARNGNGGVIIYNIDNPSAIVEEAYIRGHQVTGVDDQFPLAIGNLMTVCDEESAGGNQGCWFAPIATSPNTSPPTVMHVEPKNNSINNPTTSRIGISFNSQVELASFNTSTMIVREVGTTTPLSGKFGYSGTVVSFWPDSALKNNTQYEVILTAGGITDLVGNRIAAQFRSTFTVGTLAVQTCEIGASTPTPVGQSAFFNATNPNTANYNYSWTFGDGGTATGTTVTHAYSAPGRYSAVLIATPRTTGSPVSCSVTQIIHRPLTNNTPTTSSSVALDRTNDSVWVANPDANTVSRVNMQTRAKNLEVAVGTDPKTLARAPDGTIWVVNQGSATISVLNASTGATTATIALPIGSRPYGIAFSPDGANAYVTLEAKGQLLKINPSTRAISATLTLAGVAPEVRGVAVTADSATVLVTRFVSPRANTRGEVYKVSASSFTETPLIALANSTTPDSPNGGRGIPNYLSSLVISPDGVDAWVPSKQDNMSRGTFRDGQALTHDNTMRPITSRIDLSTGAEVLAHRVDHNDSNMPFAAATSKYGDLVFVTMMGNNRVDVVNAYTRTVVGSLSTGAAPQGVALGSNGHLYVQNFMDRTLSIIDINSILTGATATGTTLATVNLVASELLSTQVKLGKTLFYSAGRRLSSEGYISCASCHLDGGQDGRVWDFTNRGEGLRNSSTLRGRSGVGHGPAHWSGNFDEIQDFENDIRNAFGGTGLMTDADFSATSNPLGTRKAGRSADLDALAAYVTSLNSVGVSPYRNSDGTLSAAAAAGKALFATRNCITCHSGSKFTDSALNVLHNVGTIQAGSGQRLGQPLTGLDTPSLLGLWNTAPYLHNGAAGTLLDVINNASHGNASGLSTTDKNNLVAYLNSIDGIEAGVATPFTQTFQAESGVYSGGVITASNHAGYNGTGFADYPSVTGRTVFTRWTVTAPSAGSHTFTFRYALGSGSRPMNLYINGVLAGVVNFPSSGAFTTWLTSSRTGTLNAGVNTIELAADAGSVGPNVDEMRVNN